MKVKKGYAAMADARIYYEIAGTGLPITFLHGFDQDSTIWDAQFEHFASRYQVVRYDLRGCGRSMNLTDEPPDHAADFVSLMAHLGIEKSFIVGSLRGGGLAIELSLRYPTISRAAVCVGGSWWDEEAAGSTRISGKVGSRAFQGRLNQIMASVVFVTGGSDGEVVQQGADRLSRSIARSRRHRIPGCSRLPHVEAPEAFNALLSAFLRDNEFFTDMM